jgi:hydrogenase nickel incorporation protein HypA/HybF
MCEAIAGTVVDRATGRRVLSVTVRVGHLRQVVPEAMAFCWEMLTATTVLDGAALRIEHVVATVACNACGTVSTLEAPILACGSCGSRDVALRSGEELTIVALEIAAEAVTTGELR